MSLHGPWGTQIAAKFHKTLSEAMIWSYLYRYWTPPLAADATEVERPHLHLHRGDRELVSFPVVPVNALEETKLGEWTGFRGQGKKHKKYIFSKVLFHLKKKIFTAYIVYMYYIVIFEDGEKVLVLQNTTHCHFSRGECYINTLYEWVDEWMSAPHSLPTHAVYCFSSCGGRTHLMCVRVPT